MTSNANAMEEGMEADTPGTTSSHPTPTANGRRTYVLWSILGVTAVLVLALGLGFGLSNDDSDGPKSNSNSASPALSVNGNTTTETSATASGVTPSSSSSSNNNATVVIISNPDPPPVSQVALVTGRLAAISPESVSQTYASCADLAADLKVSTRLSARRLIDSYSWFFETNTYYPTAAYVEGDEGGGENVAAPPTPTMEVSLAEPARDSTSTGGASDKVQTESSFGTNNQVDGVEEPDIVQSNGNQVFAVYGSEILEIAVATSTVTRRTKVPTEAECSDTIHAMLLIGERLVIVTSQNTYCGGPIVMYDETIDVTEPMATTAPEDLPIISSYDATRVLVYDISTMTIVSDESIRGYYLNSRAIGPNVHIVTSTYFDSWRLFQFLDPYRIETEAGSRLNETEYKRRAGVELETRLDGYVEKLASELDCTGTQKVALLQNTDDDLSFSNNLESLVSITSFVVTTPGTVSTKNMLIPSGGIQLYSSAERLVLAVQGWWVSEAASQQTYLITYKYSNATTIGSTLGSVPGYLLNQFSMDHMEQNGVDYLRVATSTQSTWAMSARGIWESTFNSTSQVSILEFNDGQQGAMPMVGQIEDLGKPGESIFSVRFIGDKGFVVTFLQTDPFYTLDLSDPSNPRVAGELEIPGFSSYLHPAGDDAIIGVGQAADAEGRVTGLQISLFDVSDFSNPVRVQNFEVSTVTNSSMSSSSSEAQYDHRAFRYLEQSRLLVIPVTSFETQIVPCYDMGSPVMPSATTVSAKQASDEPVANDDLVDSSKIAIDPFPKECYNSTGGFDGFRVYQIDAVAGISQYFSIEHASGNSFAYGCWSSSYLQPRAMLFEGELMTLKGHSILTNDLSTLQESAPPVILDTEVTECNPWIYY